MKLFPCIVLGDFSVDRTAATVTTAERNRWSTTDNTDLAPSIVHSPAYNDRRSLKIDCSDPENDWDWGVGDDRVEKGIVGTDFTDRVLANPYGATTDDFTGMTYLACWLYTDTDIYSASDPDDFQMFVSGGASGTTVRTNWTSTVNAITKWFWVAGAASAGNFNTVTDAEVCGFSVDASTSLSGNIYINTFMAYRNYLSKDTGMYNYSEGIELTFTSISRNSWGNYDVSGRILAATETELAALASQLHRMETVGVVDSIIPHRPVPRYQAEQDYSLVKPYLLYGTRTVSTGAVVHFAVPILISSLSVVMDSTHKTLGFSFTGLRYGGI